VSPQTFAGCWVAVRILLVVLVLDIAVRSFFLMRVGGGTKVRKQKVVLMLLFRDGIFFGSGTNSLLDAVT
jgi:hypothetical protein